MTLQEYIEKLEAIWQKEANRALNEEFPEYGGNLVFEMKPGHSILELFSGDPYEQDEEEHGKRS